MVSKLVVIFLFQYLPVIDLQCPQFYKACKTLCINVSEPIKKSYCDASETCATIGGRLVLDSEIEIVASCYGKMFLTGITDLVNKRYANKTGWMNCDGTEMKKMNLWASSEPNNDGGNQDCTWFKDSDRLADVNCNVNQTFVCVTHNMTRVNYKTFVEDRTNIYNDKQQKGCFETVNVRSKLHCGILCFQDFNCKSYFYENISKKCALVKHVQISLPADWNTGKDVWFGYHEIKP